MSKTANTKISVWGNGFGIRLPKSFVNEGGLNVGQLLEVSLGGDNFVLIAKVKEISKVPSVEHFAKAIKKMKKVKIGELDWGSPVGKEIW